MTHLPPLILVVDDEEAGRFVKGRTLRRAGFDVRDAATGSEGLRLTLEIRPDVIVLDVNLPDMSGLEVCERLRRADSGPPAVQILQISSTAITTADRVRGLDYGADVYLIEPVDSEILIATVRALLRARRAEEALAEALQRERAARAVAEEASRLKDEFIATLSHELRTPLNALMGWIWQLRNSTLDEDAQARALDSLDRNARVQAQLINDLLDISRISKGKLHLTMQLVDLGTVIEDAVDSIHESAARRQLALGVDAPHTVIVAGDHARLLQIVTNLLTNALQFTPEHGRIDVTLSADATTATLQVRDTGTGIDQAFLPFVFDPFRQGDGGLSRKHGGLGLGLSVVHQLVDLHGGTVSASSDGVGHGTTFSLTLPLEQDAAADEAPVLSGMTILVVHPAARDLGAILEASGAHTVAAATPADADDALRDQAIDVVMSDEDVAPARAAGCPIVPIGQPTSAAQLVRQVMPARRRHDALRS